MINHNASANNGIFRLRNNSRGQTTTLEEEKKTKKITLTMAQPEQKNN